MQILDCKYRRLSRMEDLGLHLFKSVATVSDILTFSFRNIILTDKSTGSYSLHYVYIHSMTFCCRTVQSKVKQYACNRPYLWMVRHTKIHKLITYLMIQITITICLHLTSTYKVVLFRRSQFKVKATQFCKSYLYH